MDKELLIFLSFGLLQIVFYQAHKISKYKYLGKLVHSHFAVWVFHPTVLHAVQDYGIHFVIYSGRIISGH